MVPCDAIVELWIHVEVEHSSVWAKSAGKCSEVHSVFFFFFCMLQHPPTCGISPGRLESLLLGNMWV